jgi:hypothetical protein
MSRIIRSDPESLEQQSAPGRQRADFRVPKEFLLDESVAGHGRLAQSGTQRLAY